MKADGLEPLVETPADVEDERAIGDGLAEVAEVLCLALVEPAIVDDREVTLTEGAEVGVGVQGAHGLVPEELRLDGEPDVASRGTMLGDGVGEVVDDGAKEPCVHHAIHPHPVGGGWDSDIRQNVALQGVAPEGEEEGLAPPGVEGRRAIKAERNQEADVLDGDDLRVEVEECLGLVLSKGVGQRIVVNGGEGLGVVVAHGRWGEIGRSAVKGSAEAGVSRVALRLGRDGLALCICRMGESGVAGGLQGTNIGRGR
jgi:hypothetical protein